MADKTPPDPADEDVLSMGEERSPRWGLLGAVLAVLVLAVGGWQLVDQPTAPAEPEAAAAAGSEGSAQVLASDGLPRLRPDRTGTGLSVRLGARTVTLTGPDLTQAHRETSAEVVGRFGPRWVVEVTSRACKGRPDTQVTYGVARASGRFTAWESTSSRAGRAWRSPDGSLVLVDDGRHLTLRELGSHWVTGVFRTDD